MTSGDANGECRDEFNVEVTLAPPRFTNQGMHTQHSPDRLLALMLCYLCHCVKEGK